MHVPHWSDVPSPRQVARRLPSASDLARRLPSPRDLSPWHHTSALERGWARGGLFGAGVLVGVGLVLLTRRARAAARARREAASTESYRGNGDPDRAHL